MHLDVSTEEHPSSGKELRIKDLVGYYKVRNLLYEIICFFL